MAKLFVNGRFLAQPTTGVQRYATELILQWDEWLVDRRLNPADWTIEVLAPRRARELSLRRIPIRRIGRFSGHLWEQLELPRHAKDGVLFCPCNTAPLRSLIGGSPVVATVHDLSYRYFPKAYSRAFRAIYGLLTPIIFRYADRVLTDAESERKVMIRDFPKTQSRIRVVRLGGAGRSLAKEDAAAIGEELVAKPYVLYVGSMCRRKNVDGLLAASRMWVERFPKIRTVLCGASAKAFTQTAAMAKRSRNVVALGRVSDAELATLYRNAECLVFPSFHEGSGLPPLEAMANGCPVVASAIPVHYEHLADAALYCDPHDPRDIARKVETLLTDPGLSQGLRRRGLRKAAEYSWNRCAAETLEVIAEVMPIRTIPVRKAA